jgi:hypothetical protein
MACPRRRSLATSTATAWLWLLPSSVTATTPLPSGGELICDRAASGECDFSDPASRLVFAWPSDWPGRRLKLLTETGPRAWARRPGAVRWISVEYIPDDPAQPEVSLVHVTVFERAEWIAQWTRAEAIAPAGVEVATARNFVAVASVSVDNPYPADSRDADIWDALRPTAAEVSALVRFATPPAAPGSGTGSRFADPESEKENR